MNVYCLNAWIVRRKTLYNGSFTKRRLVEGKGGREFKGH